jgi:Ras-related C3 botulinum toxin substrate 1
MKSDLRDQVATNPEELDGKGMEAVPQAQGEAMKKAVYAFVYLECSAKTQTNVKGVFEAAITAVLHPPEARVREVHEEQGSPWVFCCMLFWTYCCCWPCALCEQCNHGDD